MALYPSLEDMKVDQMVKAQQNAYANNQPAILPALPDGSTMGMYQQQSQQGNHLYPTLGDYMGLQITPDMVKDIVPRSDMQVATRPTSAQMQLAPITGSNEGLMRSEIKQGIREVILCKDAQGKIGLRLRHVNNGVFVALVQSDSPAAIAGLRFGDQILQIDNISVAGWDNDKVHKYLKSANPQRICMAVRDRPFERTVTMQKDSSGYVGFVYKDGKIKSLVKDSSAARNGLLTEHQLIEVNGQNVVGLKDADIGAIIDAGGRTITVTVMPNVIYDHVVKCMGNSLVRKLMDHSIPDL
ncbi:syntenin-1-like [Argonauta hians]